MCRRCQRSPIVYDISRLLDVLCVRFEDCGDFGVQVLLLGSLLLVLAVEEFYFSTAAGDGHELGVG